MDKETLKMRGILAAAVVAASFCAVAAYADQAQPAASTATQQIPAVPVAPGATGAKHQDGRMPGMGQMSPAMKEMMAQQEELKKLIDAYKANPTDEGKAKVIAQANASFDYALKMREENLEKEKASIESFKKNKDVLVGKAVERMLSGKPVGAPEMPKDDASKLKGIEMAKPAAAAKESSAAPAATTTGTEGQAAPATK